MTELSYWAVIFLFLLGSANALVLGLFSKKQMKEAALANLRSFGQLALLGFVLAQIVHWESPAILAGILCFMVAFAAYTLRKRVDYKLFSFSQAFGAILSSVLPNVLLGLWVVGPARFLAPLFFIPFCGMLVGNSLNGLTLGFDQFFKLFKYKKFALIQSMGLGASQGEALRPLLSEALKSGLTPIINTMLIIGIVSVPGMMTGQLIAGESPLVAAKYQYFIIVAIQNTILYGILFMAFFVRIKISRRPHLMGESDA